MYHDPNAWFRSGRDRLAWWGGRLALSAGLAAVTVAAFPAQSAAAATDVSPAPALSRPVDFAHEVFPILEARCFECHGPDKQKAGLRLDAKASFLKGGKSGLPILAGEAAASLLFQRVSTTDTDDMMPPKGERLTAEQVALIRAWIDQGASWPDGVGAASAEVKHHWAYVPPWRPEPPAVKLRNWPRNDLDRFILARLEQEGLRPAPEADRATLIRRVSLDLTGLPPSPAEVDAFREDRRPDAYERLVARLLASPHYGERWARPWLDMARYADTTGYEKDERRSNWPYRDWVIHALNRDLPFDQFTLEQLAGDLLPDATTEQKVATGFHRNTMTNTEGGTDDEEFRTAAVIDRVNTTFTVWLGTTMACAQCHNHKYDPFTQREYFAAFAFFNQTRDGGKTLDPVLELPTPDQAARRAEIRAKIEPLQKLLDTQTPALDAEQAQWEAGLQEPRRAIAAGWTVLEPAGLTASNGVTLEPQPDQSVFASAAKLPETSVYELVLTNPPADVTAFRVEALTDDRLPNRSSGHGLDGDFVLTDFEVELRLAGAASDPKSAPPKLEFDKAYADFAEERFEVHKAVDKDAQSGWAIGADQEQNRTNRFAVFVSKPPTNVLTATHWVIRLKQESIRPKNLLGRFRLAYSTTPAGAHRVWGDVPAGIRALLEVEPAQRTDAQKAELARHHRGLAPSLAPVRAEVAELRKQEPKDIATTLVMREVDPPRVTRVLKRGSFLDPGDEVQPGTPAVLPPMAPDLPRNRLGLARWLVSPENPLVGRVTMNRLWAAYFGRGLVETSEDFGSQGELPSHPELLDWLATEFVRQGWSLKAMHRLIVTSATYRQSARVTPELLERDPYNRLLARGARFRMEAEMLRDTTLAAAGLLNPRIGGPGVFPYQPEGVWAMPYSDDKWVMNTNGHQFRRGLYTFARRSFPYAAFVTFDAPSREVCTERRPRTNTPLQALVTLNDPAFFAAAGGLARRVAIEGGAEDRERLMFAFKAVLGRAPTKKERAATLELLNKARARFAAAPDSAARLLTQAALPEAASQSRYASELAAWTVVANVLLNLDEALTKG
jgi:mono/diheme cytochrome c family protein